MIKKFLGLVGALVVAGITLFSCTNNIVERESLVNPEKEYGSIIKK